MQNDESIKSKVLDLTYRDYGFVDDFASSSTHFLLGGDDISKCEVLYCFTHGGVSFPEKYRGLLRGSDAELAEVIYQNYDIGKRMMIDHLAKRISAGDKSIAVMVYDVTRVVCDGNRTTREEQMPEQAYRGEGVWNVDLAGREQVAAELVDPFVEEYRQVIERLKPKFIFYPHTYDEYGGGKASGGHELVTTREKRPVSMIFNHHDLVERPYGIYADAKGERVELDLLTERQIELITEIQKKYLGQIDLLKEAGEEVEVRVDYPYASPRQLPLYVSSFYDVPQLVLEYRKDLFKSAQARELILKSLDEIAWI